MLSDKVASGEGEGGHKDECLCSQAGREVVHLDTECKRRFMFGEG